MNGKKSRLLRKITGLAKPLAEDSLKVLEHTVRTVPVFDYSKPVNLDGTPHKVGEYQTCTAVHNDQSYRNYKFMKRIMTNVHRYNRAVKDVTYLQAQS